MTVRCLLSTSSYLSTFLRISKFCCSTWVCALRMALVTMPASIGTSSGSRTRFMIDSIIWALNRRIRSSPRER